MRAVLCVMVMAMIGAGCNRSPIAAKERGDPLLVPLQVAGVDDGEGDYDAGVEDEAAEDEAGVKDQAVYQAPADSGSAPLACFLRAEDQVSLNEGEAFELCRSARSAAPAECFARAQQATPLFDAQIIELCRCARSTQPVDCYRYADQATFLDDYRIVQLCAATAVLGLYDNCLPYYRTYPTSPYR